jgi:hypothetical protein
MPDHVDLHAWVHDSTVLGRNPGPRAGCGIRLTLLHRMEDPAIRIESIRDDGTRVHAEAVNPRLDPIGWSNVVKPGDSLVGCHPTSLAYPAYPVIRDTLL